MLALARILRTGSRLLLLDEPSEGLAPVVVKEIGEMILKIKARGYTVFWLNKICVSPARSPTGTSSSNTAKSPTS